MKVQRTATQSKQADNLARWLEQVTRVMSGNISFGASMANAGELLPNGTINKDDSQNMSVWKASGITPPTAGTEFAIPHQLKYIPLTILGADLDQPGTLYRGPTAWTAAPVQPTGGTPPVGYIHLRSTVANAHYNVIFG